MKCIKVINKTNKRKHQQLVNSMYELRHAVFKERLNWDVQCSNKKEIDEYDAQPGAKYIIVTNDQKEALGCMRLLPTTQKYMIKDTFCAIGKNVILPESKNVWEITRFAVDNHRPDQHSLSGFGNVSTQVIYGMCDFAVKNSITHYITLTTPCIERLIKNLGLSTKRMGPLEKINDLKVVILEIAMNQQSLDAINQRIEHIEHEVDYT